MKNRINYRLAAEKLSEQVSILAESKWCEAIKCKGGEWKKKYSKYKNAQKAQKECEEIIKNNDSAKKKFEKILDVYNSLASRNIF